MVYEEGEARKHGNHDAAFPRGPFSVCFDCPMDDRVANPVLHFNITHGRPITPHEVWINHSDRSREIEDDLRGNKELVLNIHEMFGELNSYGNGT